VTKLSIAWLYHSESPANPILYGVHYVASPRKDRAVLDSVSRNHIMW